MQSLLALIAVGWVAFLTFFGLQTNASTVGDSVGTPSSVKFIVFGDSGTGDEEQKELSRVMDQYPIDAILHTGDLAYPSGSREDIQKNFLDIYANLLAKADFYPSPGNHDYESDNLRPYLTQFGKGRYYAIDKGPVHFISLDSNNLQAEGEILDWLRKDLANVSGKKWIVVFFHHSPYSSGKTHGNNDDVRTILVPLFSEYRVNVVFSGHEHNYERMKPMNGTTYIVTGGGSGSLYDFDTPLVMSAVRASQSHFVYVDASSCTLTGKAINLRNLVIDSFTLRRCNQ